MVNFLFLVDTSYVMNTKVGEYGLTLLELCKTAIHRSVNNRRKSVSKPTDSNSASKFNHKYLLVTYSSTCSVQCGWENSTDYFLKAIESLHATDAPNFGTALSTAFRLLQSNPNQILSYGQGWKSWQNEMNVIMILTYCIDPSSSASKSIQQKRNEILRLPPRNLSGDELETDYIQWNTRIFVGNINVFGTLQMDTQTNSIRDALNNLCLETSPTDAIHVINNELHSLGQIERWVSAIMRDNCRDGVTVEFWDSSKEETASEDDATNSNPIGKFNDGQLFREFIIPTRCDGKWPIPESYSPKEHHHELPSRRCRPLIAISRAQKGAACLPRSEWNVPYEQYEITSPRLRDFLLNLPHTICYYAYIQYSAGAKFNFAKPWGTLKGDPKRNKAFLYVFVYDFPFVWNQISVFLQAKKRNFKNFSSDEWKRAVGAYLNFIPAYYIQSVKDLLMQTTKGVHLPPFPSCSSLEPSIMSYVNELQRKWRGNSDYKANNNAKAITAQKAAVAVDDSDISMIHAMDVEAHQGANERGLHGFPFDAEDEDEEDCEEGDILLNAISKNRKHNKPMKESPKKMDLQLPFMVNTRKRSWSQQNNQATVYNQTRKRRKRFYQTHMDTTQPSHNQRRDDELIAYVADKNIGDLMNDLTLSIFGDNGDDIKQPQDIKHRKDSFDVSLDRLQQTRAMDVDAQNKLLSKFASMPQNNKASVYGHSNNNMNAWKNQYKLVLDQKEDDKQHIEKHNNMGNYTMYTEKLRMGKKDEFRNPFQIETEYSNYALSLSFIFLQQKIHAQEGNTKQIHRKPKQIRGKSFLETETRLKSDKLLSIEEVLAIKKQTSEAIWTKNEISTTFYEDNSDPMPRKSGTEYQHSLLKSADWLSCQVLHNLKPTNLGGNPFKKRRKKSPFPSVVKPRNMNHNRNNNNGANAVQLQKQKEQQSKFEQEVANSLPHLSGLMVTKERKEDTTPAIIEDNTSITAPPIAPPQVTTPPPPPPPQAKKPKPPQISPPPPLPPSKPKKATAKPPMIASSSSSNTSANMKSTKNNASKLKTSKKPMKPLILSKPKLKAPKIDINKAIESAKRRQKIRQRPTQILPMKRRDRSSTNSTSSSSHSHSISPEPVSKKQKLSNGVKNGSNIKMKSIENNKNHNALNHNHYNNNNHKKSDKKQKMMHYANMNANVIQIVNTNHINHINPHNINMNGHNNVSPDPKPHTTESQAMDILAFMEKYRERVRSPNKFDHVWFENGLTCLNGLAGDTKTRFYQLLMQEAITYNRYQLAQNIHKMYKNI